MYNAYRYVIANDGIDTAKSYPYHEQVYTVYYIQPCYNHY